MVSAWHGVGATCCPTRESGLTDEPVVRVGLDLAWYGVVFGILSVVTHVGQYLFEVPGQVCSHGKVLRG